MIGTAIVMRRDPDPGRRALLATIDPAFTKMGWGQLNINPLFDIISLCFSWLELSEVFCSLGQFSEA